MMTTHQTHNQTNSQSDHHARWLADMAEESAVIPIALRVSPDDTPMWDRMESLDRLFRTAPMVDAPRDFTSKVMFLITAPDDTDTPNGIGNNSPKGWRRFLNLPPRTLLSIAIVLPLALGVGLMALQNPMAIAILLHQAILWFNSAMQTTASLISVLAQVAPSSVFTPTLLTLTVAIVGVWLWSLAYASDRRQQPVYHIPVRFH